MTHKAFCHVFLPPAKIKLKFGCQILYLFFFLVMEIWFWNLPDNPWASHNPCSRKASVAKPGVLNLTLQIHGFCFQVDTGQRCWDSGIYPCPWDAATVWRVGRDTVYKNMYAFNTMAEGSESTPILYCRVGEWGDIKVSKIKLPIDGLISKAELRTEANFHPTWKNKPTR